MEVNLLFAIDQRFVRQLKTTLYSIQKNSSATTYNVYLLHPEETTFDEELTVFCQLLGMNYYPLKMDRATLFAQAPVTERYPEIIYYRLLAHQFLPDHLEKILYLDADILCINDAVELYQMEMGDYLYAAASHTHLTNVTNVINKIRLKTYEAEGYYNSGVLLMNLKQIRKVVKAEDIFTFIENNRLNLLLPDQDILNGLYGDQFIAVSDFLFNYDVRKSAVYETTSLGKWDVNHLIEETVFLHFCGKSKPWDETYKGKFATLYKHYQHKAGQLENNVNVTRRKTR